MLPDQEEVLTLFGTDRAMRKHDWVNILRGLVARLLFTGHVVICAKQYSQVLCDTKAWFMLILLAIIYAEFILLIVLRRGKEWKWFLLSILCYLLTVVPTLWILEIRSLKILVDGMNNNSCGNDSKISNETSTILGLQMTHQEWSVTLQQILLFVLIIGRWILPRGPVTSDQISQLLLIQIGIGADILEFSTEGLRLPEVQAQSSVVYVILAVWTASLFQFTLCLTLRKRRKPRANVKGFQKFKSFAGMCCATEVWSIVVTSSLQDGPFLLVRIYLISIQETQNQLLIFFMLKNILVLLLQCYRLWVLLNRRLDMRRSQRIAVKLGKVRHGVGDVGTLDSRNNGTLRPGIMDTKV
ncbi:transmembrane protein 26-like [Antedon mediterranea]|uniref:transmembrane protein 26-like n=1 Tax=Antedon mediterranea TaxID=105859 RepID=UPI003AF97B8B